MGSRARRLLVVVAVASTSLLGACVLFPDLSDLVGDGIPHDAGEEADAPAVDASLDATCEAGPVDPSLLSDAVQVSLGNGFACAVRTSGDVACWGQYYRGQFGYTPDGGVGTQNVNHEYRAVRVTGLPPMASIAAGDSHVCGVDRDGYVWCWGFNSNGQLGNGLVSPSRASAFTGGYQVIDWDPKPAQVLSKSGGLLQRALSVSAGVNHSCAVVQGGVITCWGHNQYGQLGVRGGLTDSGAIQIETTAVPSALATGGAVSVAAGNFCACAAIQGTPSSVRCVGSNADNQLGATPPDSGIPITMPLPANADRPKAVAATFYLDNHTVVLDVAGNVFGSGNNSVGQIGAFASSQPAAIPGLSNANVTAVSTGPSHTCALLTDSRVECIGRNNSGALGRGFYSDRENNPGPVTGPDPDAAVDASDTTRLLDVMDVSVGLNVSCAIVRNACRTDGTVYCWGQNYVGQLGDGTNVQRSRPTAVVAPRP